MHAQIAEKLLASGNCICILAAGLSESATADAVVRLFTTRAKLKPLIVKIEEEGESIGEKREAVYAAGGLVKVTARVALSDLLSRRLDPSLVNMILVENVGNLSQNSNTIFCVQVYREANPSGNLICLSEKGCPSISNLIKWLYISDLIVFPRFHEIVHAAINDSDLQVFEEECLLTDLQMQIQSCLLNIVNSSLIEIGPHGKEVNGVEILRNGSEFFSLKKNLESSWLKIPWRMRQIVLDLSVIRKLAKLLVRSDSAGFYRYVKSQKEISFKTSPWWFSQDAQNLMLLTEKNCRTIHPKWVAIDRILAPMSSEVVLLACHDDEERSALQILLGEGPDRAVLERLKILRDTQNELDSIPSFPGYTPAVSVCLFSELKTSLETINPNMTILVEPHLGAIRTIEIYREKIRPMRVHILNTANGFGQVSFADQIGKEMKMFDDLIRGSFSFRSKAELFELVSRKTRIAPKRTRKGGSDSQIEESIIVDSRELRSALPFVLYRTKKFRIVAATLQIGDYILSRDICIERKSVTGNDLQQSLLSGRLYRQLVNMVFAFAWPVLLLEFNNGAAFQLQSTESLGEINPGSLIAQIISLIIHFPSLRIVWSPSFEFSANIFASLKRNRDQPRIVENKNEQKRWIEFLKVCPGITPSNLPRVLNRAKSLKELVVMGEEDLVDLLGKRDANLFTNFINHNSNSS